MSKTENDSPQSDFEKIFQDTANSVATHFDIKAQSNAGMKHSLELEKRWTQFIYESISEIVNTLCAGEVEKASKIIEEVGRKMAKIVDQNVVENVKYISMISTDAYATGYTEGAYAEITNYNKTMKNFIKEGKLPNPDNRLALLIDIKDKKVQEIYDEIFKDKPLIFYAEKDNNKH